MATMMSARLALGDKLRNLHWFLLLTMLAIACLDVA